MLRHFMRWRISAIVLATGAVILWPIPVFQILHVESSAVVAALAWLTTGLAASIGPLTLRGFTRLITTHLVYLAVPLLLLTASMPWAPNCAYLTGLAYFIAFAVPSAVMGGALGYMTRVIVSRGKRITFALATVVLALAGLVHDLGFHPQFYTYNHVFGGVVGPLYDEDISFRGAVVWFRTLSLLWAGTIVVAAIWVRSRRAGAATLSRRTTLSAVVLVIPIGLIYLNSARLGINTPEWLIREELGGITSTPNFDIYHSAELSEVEAAAISWMYEYHLARISATLDVQPSQRISVYLYPDPFIRERLTGARHTNVAPIWLPTPQIHVLATIPERVHAHELVHVLSREFGLPVIRSSISVGLVEGVAVALESPSGGPSPHDQVAAVLDDGRFEVTDVARRLTPAGFWGGRGAVSYTSSGSFVSYLLDAYDPALFKQAYASGRLARTYGQSVGELAQGWEAYLRSRPVISAQAARTATTRFAVPSLFEVRCPHYVPPHRRRFIEAQRALAEGDTTTAIDRLSASLERAPEFAPAALLLADLHLSAGNAHEVPGILDVLPPSFGKHLRLGDAAAVVGDVSLARAHYKAVDTLVVTQAHDVRAWLHVRQQAVGRPLLVEALYRGLPAAASAEDRYEALILAQAALRDGEWESALQLLTDVSFASGELDEMGWLLKRLRLRMLAAAAFRTSNYEEPLAVLNAGITLAGLRGDVDTMRLLEHYVARMSWTADARSH
jgi:tetratricopeptide (TPR) repeat protein